MEVEGLIHSYNIVLNNKIKQYKEANYNDNDLLIALNSEIIILRLVIKDLKNIK